MNKLRRAQLTFTARVAAAGSADLAAQVQTEVPPVIADAKPVGVEHIRIHGTSLEGNREGEVVDREVFVFLPPSYTRAKKRRYPVVSALHGFSIDAEQWSHGSKFRKPSRARSPRGLTR